MSKKDKMITKKKRFGRNRAEIGALVPGELGARPKRDKTNDPEVVEIFNRFTVLQDREPWGNETFEKAIVSRGLGQKRKRFEYNESLAEMVLYRLANGESLVDQQKSSKYWPCVPDIMRWIVDVPGFATRLEEARAIYAEGLFNDMISVSRGTLSGKIDPSAAKVAYDISKWALTKINPNKFGEKVTIKVGKSHDEIINEMYANMENSEKELSGENTGPELIDIVPENEPSDTKEEVLEDGLDVQSQ